MEDVYIVSNNTALLNFGRGATHYTDTVEKMRGHITSVDQAPLLADVNLLVYLWELKYGYAATPTELIAMDDFMSLAAVRLAQEGKLAFVTWDDPELLVQAGPLARAHKFEGYQLNADS